MYALLHPFVQIVLLRAKPQDLPCSTLLLGLALTAHAVLGIAVFAFRLDPAQAIAAGMVSTLLLVAMTVSLLYVNRLQARATQTLTALAGADVVISWAALPVTAWLHGTQDQSAASGLPGLLFLLILFWSLAVSGHILRHALNAPLPLGVVISLVFYVLSVNVLHALFPGMS